MVDVVDAVVVCLQPGKSWVSNCMNFDCSDTLAGPTLISYSFSCPPFNETECMKVSTHMHALQTHTYGDISCAMRGTLRDTATGPVERSGNLHVSQKRPSCHHAEHHQRFSQKCFPVLTSCLSSALRSVEQS